MSASEEQDEQQPAGGAAAGMPRAAGAPAFAPWPKHRPHKVPLEEEPQQQDAKDGVAAQQLCEPVGARDAPGDGCMLLRAGRGIQ